MKEKELLKNLVKYLDEYAQIDLDSPYWDDLTKEDKIEAKAQKDLALEILVKFNLHQYKE